jgi:hypothetical protein
LGHIPHHPGLQDNIIKSFLVAVCRLLAACRTFDKIKDNLREAPTCMQIGIIC